MGSRTERSDVVSSATLPGLSSLPESALPGLLRGLDEKRNHFHGVGPAELAAAFARTVSPGAGWESVGPWRWSLHSRVYLVRALKSQRPVTALTTSGP